MSITSDLSEFWGNVPLVQECEKSQATKPIATYFYELVSHLMK